MMESQWARLLAALRGRPGSRHLFEEYARLAELPRGGADHWRRIEKLARQWIARSDRRRGRPPTPLPPAGEWP